MKCYYNKNITCKHIEPEDLHDFLAIVYAPICSNCITMNNRMHIEVALDRIEKAIERLRATK